MDEKIQEFHSIFYLITKYVFNLRTQRQTFFITSNHRKTGMNFVALVNRF